MPKRKAPEKKPSGFNPEEVRKNWEIMNRIRTRIWDVINEETKGLPGEHRWLLASRALSANFRQFFNMSMEPVEQAISRVANP